MRQALSEMHEEFTVKSIRELLSAKRFIKIDQSRTSETLMKTIS